jgi:hypothetical protein
LESSFVIKFSIVSVPVVSLKETGNNWGSTVFTTTKIDQSFFNRILCSKANSPGGFSGAKNRKNEANFDGFFEIFYVIKIGGKILFTEK